MDGRAGWRGPREPTGQRHRVKHRCGLPWALAAVLAWGLSGAAGASAEQSAPERTRSRSFTVVESAPARAGRSVAGTIDFRRALEPTEEERSRVLEWHRIWREETGPLRRTLGRLGAEEHAAPVADRAWCVTLGRAVLAVDRERVFPAPSYGVGVRLTRGLGALVRAANACFEGRTHEAAFRLAQAHEAFAGAAWLLGPYGVAP